MRTESIDANTRERGGRFENFDTAHLLQNINDSRPSASIRQPQVSTAEQFLPALTLVSDATDRETLPLLSMAAHRNFRNAGDDRQQTAVSPSRERVLCEMASNASLSRTSEARRELQESVNERYSRPEMRERQQRFIQDMQQFEARATRSGLTPVEIENTYHQIARILNAGQTARLSEEQRLALASQVMHNVADPTQIRQNTNTCNVTTLETRIYTRNPSAAAGLIADVALKGSFTGRDGTVVTLDGSSLQPSTAGTVDLSAESRQRTFASQLFQVTAANIALLQETRSPERLRYAQVPPTGKDDSGERLFDSNSRVIAQDPGWAMQLNSLVGAHESITGSADERSFLRYAGEAGRRANRVFQFETAEQLGQQLERLQRQNQLPAVIFVHGSNAMFRPGGRGREVSNDGHYITVTGYDPVRRLVRFDDQYGRDADHNDAPVSLRAFYNATRSNVRN